MKGKKPWWKPQLNWWQQIIVIIILLALLGSLLGKYGIYGVLGLVIAMALYRFIEHRKVFTNIFKVLEGTIWGKPLDKENWEKGELKNTKVKIVWGNKK